MVGLALRVYGFTRVPVECFLRATSFEGSRRGFLRALHVQVCRVWAVFGLVLLCFWLGVNGCS